jgi:hypothetical protein
MDVKSGARRYADTGVLLSDFTSRPFDSDRRARALARMNFLHSHYPILNDDFLYTLSVFVVTPQRWIEKYEWRPLTELEIAVNALIPCLNFSGILTCRHGGFSGGRLDMK